jgi:hypothetical protein
MVATDRLPELLKILGTVEFEDHGRMRVVDVHWSIDRVEVRLKVDEGTGHNSSWQIRFRGVLEQKFTVIDHCGLNVWRDNHPAIDQYQEPREFLHFGAAPLAPHEIVGRLWAAHVAVVDDWIPFDRYLNCELPLADLLAYGSGLLATGPAFLISAYAAVLDNAGCMPVVKRLPTRRKDYGLTLTHFGESYVVSKEIIVRKIATH